MPNPVILGFGGTNSGANVTTTTVDIVTRVGGTPRIGDLVIILLCKDGTGTFTWPAEWLQLPNFPISDGAQMLLDAAYRYIVNGDNLSPTITHASEGTTQQVYWLDGSAAISGTPESTTVGGSSTNPDPPSITPSWGARTNTLFIAVAGNDGNVAITAAPTNYTNFQNDRWANTNGVGIASARRFINNSPENPGVFTMAIEQWGAGTIAINPGNPVGEEFNNSTRTNNTNIPPQPKLYLATTVSVLPPDLTAAFSQLDWPNPAPARRLALTHVNNNLENTIAPIVAPPFIPIDAPNPQLKGQQNKGFSNNRPQFYQDLTPNNRYDWPNPGLKGQQNKGFTNPTTAYFVTTAPPPFVPVEFRNPDLKKQQNTGSTSARPQYYVDLNPNNQYNWPIPSPKKLKHETWIQNLLQNTLAPVITQAPFNNGDLSFIRRTPYIITDVNSFITVPPATKPFNNLEYPTPQRKPYLITILNSGVSVSQDRPHKQTDYPNPSLKRKIPNTWIFNRKPDEPAQEYMPCSVLDWPNPSPKRKIALTHIGQIAQLQQIFTTPTSRLPIYPDRLDGKKSAITWIQNRPFYYTDAVQNPFNNLDWNQIRRRETLITSHLQRFIQSGVIGNPFSQKEWPNPQRKKRLPEQWEFWYQQDDNVPFINQITNNPLRKRIQALSWFQSPLVASPISGAPFNQALFNNPALARKLVQFWLNPSLSVSEFPILQFNWSNPLTRNKLAETWIQNRPFYLEDLIPFSQNDYPNPQLVKISNRGYIFNQQIQEVTSPPTYDYPNPRLTERQTESWINNLLQSTLNPGAGDVPFYQNNWPIPDRKKIGLDWIFSRPFIFEVVAVPFVKSEWPNPEVIIRNSVGYINYLIPREEVRISSVLDIPLKKKIEALTWLQNLQENTLGPLPVTSFTQKDWPNPLRGRRNQVGHVESRLNYITGNVPFALIDFKVPGKKGPAITYIYNSLINLNEVVGIQPFNQYDWPLVRGKGQQNKGFVISGGYILPNIIGRIICLNADVTLYDLEAALQEFDLDATTTEYNLEAGGTECE